MSNNQLICNEVDLEIYGYSIYPHFSGNYSDDMVAELLIRNKSEDIKIQMRHYLSSKSIRAMGEKLISMANAIDDFNNQPKNKS